METVNQEAKNGITHNNENVPALVTLVNEKLEMAIKRAAYKYMMTEEEMRRIIYS
jgi:hypothetical protein